MPADNTNLTQVAFSGTGSFTTPKALNTTSRFTSDAFAFSADATDCKFQFKVDNQGTPASGDTVTVQLALSIDGGTTYDTDEHARSVAYLDTYATNDPGEDPATRTYTVDVRGATHGKILAKAAQGGTRTINFSAQFNEHTAT